MDNILSQKKIRIEKSLKNDNIGNIFGYVIPILRSCAYIAQLHRCKPFPNQSKSHNIYIIRFPEVEVWYQTISFMDYYNCKI